jgi:putative tryptophan/tyrosine transport system substrate-binding protein
MRHGGRDGQPTDCRDLSTFARSSRDGLIVTTSVLATVHREHIIALAARHRLPAIYPYRFYVLSGRLDLLRA